MTESVFAIRVKALPQVWGIPQRMPWKLGDWMAATHSPYAGQTLEVAGSAASATFFPTREAAETYIRRCSAHVCTYEAVEFRRVR